MNDSFFDVVGDERMENQNQENWNALIRLILRESRNTLPDRPWDILDIGCHAGGFLEAMQHHPGVRLGCLSGVEPLGVVRERAKHRLNKAIFFERFSSVPSLSADVIVSHEALYLVEDLHGWIRELKRVLRPDGGAYIALGSHGENTAWLRWRHRLQELYGHISYVHQPMEVLHAGANAGFEMEIRRLHPGPSSGMRYSSPKDGWGEFLSVKEALEFRWQKYVFVFYPQR